MWCVLVQDTNTDRVSCLKARPPKGQHQLSIVTAVKEPTLEWQEECKVVEHIATEQTKVWQLVEVVVKTDWA